MGDARARTGPLLKRGISVALVLMVLGLFVGDEMAALSGLPAWVVEAISGLGVFEALMLLYIRGRL